MPEVLGGPFSWVGLLVSAVVGLLLGPALASLTVRVPVAAGGIGRESWTGGGASGGRIVGVALGTAVVLASFGFSWPMVRTWMPVVALAGVVLVVVDVEHHRLPDLVVLPTLVVFLAANTLARPDLAVRMLVTGGAFFAVFFGLALLSPRGLGLGDVKLAGLIGVVLGRLGGVDVVSLWLLATCAASVLWVGLLLATRRATLRSAVAFGPPLLVGLWVVVVLIAALAA